MEHLADRMTGEIAWLAESSPIRAEEPMQPPLHELESSVVSGCDAEGEGALISFSQQPRLRGTRSATYGGRCGTMAVIPPRKNRNVQYRYDKTGYRQHNIIERMFCRLNDWRRIATRFDRNIKNFIAAITLAAAVIWWLK